MQFSIQETNVNMNRNIEDGDEESSGDEQTGEGIQFPGYEPKVPEYSGPSFPPQLSRPDPMVGGETVATVAPLVSDVMAEDLRSRDILEHNAITWWIHAVIVVVDVIVVGV